MIKYNIWKIVQPKRYKGKRTFYETEEGFLKTYNKLKEQDRFLRQCSNWKAYQFTDEGWVEYDNRS